MAWMDGGSITLKCENDLNQNFEIEFVQNVIWEVYDSQNLSGRIYLDKELIEQRSLLETEIINILRQAKMQSNDSLDLKMLNDKLDYVESGKYITDQSKIRYVKRK